MNAHPRSLTQARRIQAAVTIAFGDATAFGRLPYGLGVFAAADAIRKSGLACRHVVCPDPLLDRARLIHLICENAADNELALARYANASGVPLVVSPAYAARRDEALWDAILPDLFDHRCEPDDLDASVVTAIAAYRRGASRGNGSARHDGVFRELSTLAAHFVVGSRSEQVALSQIGAAAQRATIVPRPVHPRFFQSRNCGLIEALTGVKDFVLCVGRLEPASNQLLLLRALAGTEIPIVLLAPPSADRYARLVDRWAGPNVHFVPAGTHEADLIGAACAEARVVVQPCWREGPSSIVEEAAVAGARIVTSTAASSIDQPPTEFIDFVDPGDMADIRDAVLTAYDRPLSLADRAASRDSLRETRNYDAYVETLVGIYDGALEDLRDGRRPTRSISLAPIIDEAATSALTSDSDGSTLHNLTERNIPLATLPAYRIGTRGDMETPRQGLIRIYRDGSARSTILTFLLSKPHAGDLSLVLEARHTGGSEPAAPACVRLGRHILGVFRPDADAWRIFSLEVPAAALAARDILPIEVELASSEAAASERLEIRSASLVDRAYPFRLRDYATDPAARDEILDADIAYDLTQPSVAGRIMARPSDGRPGMILRFLPPSRGKISATLRFRAAATPERPFKAIARTGRGRVIGILDSVTDTIQTAEFSLPTADWTMPLALTFDVIPLRRRTRAGQTEPVDSTRFGFVSLEFRHTT